MKTCSLHDFINELKPWLDSDHIRTVTVDLDGAMVVHFMDGMKNVYAIDDCNREQINDVLADLKKRGLKIEI